MELNVNEERLRLVSQITNDGLYDWDLQTNEVYYSPQWKAMLGYADEELENQLSTWLHLLHPEDRETTLKYAKDYIGGIIDRFEVVFRLRHKHGYYISVLSRACLLRDADNKVVRMVGTNVDLTKVGRLTETGSLQEHFHRVLLSKFPFAAWLKDKE